MELYEDLFDLHKSACLGERISKHERVLNTSNTRVGVKARRGDGTFGELVPGSVTVADPGFRVARGRVATVEIGIEMKILAKAMIKQIDRVKSDLLKQVQHFKRKGGDPMCVGIVGINQAKYCVGYEGERATRTDGMKNKHPREEAAEAEKRLQSEVAAGFDEFLILRYQATNDPPFGFRWVNLNETEIEYAAALTRISRKYDTRFR